MNFRDFRQAIFSVLLAMSLFTASFAGPLCACLETKTETPKHDCCPPEAKDHCQMGAKKGDESKPDVAAIKAVHDDCGCSVEKRENAPAKIVDAGTQHTAILAKNIQHEETTAVLVIAQNVPLFTRDLFSLNSWQNQTSARAPPRL